MALASGYPLATCGQSARPCGQLVRSCGRRAALLVHRRTRARSPHPQTTLRSLQWSDSSRGVTIHSTNSERHGEICGQVGKPVDEPLPHPEVFGLRGDSYRTCTQPGRIVITTVNSGRSVSSGSPCHPLGHHWVITGRSEARGIPHRDGTRADPREREQWNEPRPAPLGSRAPGERGAPGRLQNGPGATSVPRDSLPRQSQDDREARPGVRDWLGSRLEGLQRT